MKKLVNEAENPIEVIDALYEENKVTMSTKEKVGLIIATVVTGIPFIFIRMGLNKKLNERIRQECFNAYVEHEKIFDLQVVEEEN